MDVTGGFGHDLNVKSRIGGGQHEENAEHDEQKQSSLYQHQEHQQLHEHVLDDEQGVSPVTRSRGKNIEDVVVPRVNDVEVILKLLLNRFDISNTDGVMKEMDDDISKNIGEILTNLISVWSPTTWQTLDRRETIRIFARRFELPYRKVVEKENWQALSENLESEIVHQNISLQPGVQNRKIKLLDAETQKKLLKVVGEKVHENFRQQFEAQGFGKDSAIRKANDEILKRLFGRFGGGNDIISAPTSNVGLCFEDVGAEMEKMYGVDTKGFPNSRYKKSSDRYKDIIMHQEYYPLLEEYNK